MMIACSGGCTQGYNGAFLLHSQDKQAREKYEKFKQQQKLTRTKAAEEAQIRTQDVEFHGGAGLKPASLVQSERTLGPLVPPRSVQPATATPRPRRRDPRFLLGQIDPGESPVASPMDGTANLQQVTFATDGADFDPALDRTGQLLVYASTQHRDTSDLYIKRVDGTTIRQLTDDPANEATPQFSPDGKWVAYASDQAGNWDIYLVDVAKGGPSQQVTSSPNDEIHPSFSPDGKQVVFCTLGSRAGQWEMVVIDLDNPGIPRYIGHGLFPEWSPIGNRIVYQRAREKGSRHFGIWALDLVNSEGTRPTQIAVATNAAAITPSWSPDGKTIVFCTIVNPRSDLQEGTPVQSDVWVINADGTGRTNVTRSRFANLQPVWAPDGSIYFVSNRGHNGTENIWAVRTAPAVHVARGVSDDAAEPATQTAEVPE